MQQRPAVFALLLDAIEVARKLGGDVSTCGLGATASDPLLTGERQRELLRTVAIPFFDAYLRGSDKARELIADLPNQLPELRFQSQLK